MVASLRVIVVTSVIAGLAALAGWLAASPFGRRTAFVAASVVGTMGVLVAIRLVADRAWFNPARTRGGSIGGLVGFALAVPLAAMPMQRPGVMLASAALIGVGVIVGSGGGATK